MNEIVKPDSLIMAEAQSLTETFFGGCPHDCPDTCSMLFDVKDGQLQGVRGNPDHPMTRGGLCVKLKDYEKRHYHPDRLLYPMKRVGPKGSKQFERITWDEALDTIVTRWKAIIYQYGPHLVGGLPGESDGENALWVDALTNEVHEATGQRAGFARAGPGQAHT